jgi:hypothetical protein
MRKLRIVLSLTIALLLNRSALADSTLQTPEQPSPAAAGTTSYLTLQLSTNQKQYRSTDPITINVKISNPGPLQVQWSYWRPIYWMVNLTISPLGSTSVVAEGARTQYIEQSTRIRALDAGSSLTLSAPISAWGFQLSELGQYQISASGISSGVFQNYSAGPVIVRDSAPALIKVY